MPSKPTREELAAAASQTLPDILAPDLDIVFCGINPGLYSTAVGHHFGRPGNRFWPTLHLAGFTPRVFTPAEDRDLLQLGYGITNVVGRTTARADELTKEELLAGAQVLEEKMEKFRPRFLAVLGITAYRAAFRQPKAQLGEQPARIADTRLWVLPNPSGLNASFQLPDLARVFGDLRQAADEVARRG